ncbi:hypothetical protein D3C87_2085380 [compost metagenome]
MAAVQIRVHNDLVAWLNSFAVGRNSDDLSGNFMADYPGVGNKGIGSPVSANI